MTYQNFQKLFSEVSFPFKGFAPGISRNFCWMVRISGIQPFLEFLETFMENFCTICRCFQIFESYGWMEIKRPWCTRGARDPRELSVHQQFAVLGNRWTFRHFTTLRQHLVLAGVLGWEVIISQRVRAVFAKANLSLVWNTNYLMYFFIYACDYKDASSLLGQKRTIYRTLILKPTFPRVHRFCTLKSVYIHGFSQESGKERWLRGLTLRDLSGKKLSYYLKYNQSTVAFW